MYVHRLEIYIFFAAPSFLAILKNGIEIVLKLMPVTINDLFSHGAVVVITTPAQFKQSL